MTAARLLAAGCVIHLALVLPAAPMPAGDALLRIAPDLPLVLLALSWLGRAGRVAIAAALTLLVMQKIADLAMAAALGRPFNAIADGTLIRAGLDLLADAVGGPALSAGSAAVIAATMAGLWALWWACGIWSGRASGRHRRLGLAALAALSLIAAGSGLGWHGNGPYAAAKVALLQKTARDLRQIRALAARDHLAGADGLLRDIDRDVLVIFVESYGRASFDAPFHAERHMHRLLWDQDRLAQAGLAMRSGFLAAPTQGGQSWLSHASFASGLRVADQAGYGAVLASGRQGLFHHARRAGFRTAAVMPAITRPWPESATMGFDRVLAADDLGYRGRPFNWVTMPDQFTLAALDRLLRQADDPRPLFAQVALISSHAPWVPVPRLLPWDQLGDGRIFDAMAVAGDPPQVLWRDRDRVRAAYRDAVDYSLATVMDYAALHAADPPLMIVLGDHQAAPWVAMDDRPDVPIHVIGPAALVDRTADWGLTPGLIPPQDSAALPMDRMRDLILRGFGGPDPRPLLPRRWRPMMAGRCEQEFPCLRSR
ncbi:sulfatase-like hydrolase/transferase [uncultured Paracoccus sp.]|uniref:sulfatase-like hydrolase/transferase n=1 Tax=uncultured Paracoccus sp. TaxID=189685 RepID=UPI0025DDCAA8|nr:sulfatase-like hydrolase/transferase [uncultured Paracoccus sp.]